MRKAALLALVPLLAAALGAQAPGDRGAGEIAVRVLPPSPLTYEPLRFELSEPGYVAAFMIYPGHGVRLIYPDYSGVEQLWSAGYHSARLGTLSWDDDVYHAVLGGTGSGPGYLYVIASRYPLEVSRFVHRPALLANSVGQVDARSFLVNVEFDALVNNAIALGNDATWDADSYMLWPASSFDGAGYGYGYGFGYGNGYSAGRYTTRLMTCADGTVRAVPENYPFTSCGHRQRIFLPRASTPLGGQVARVVPPTVLPSIVGGRSTRSNVKTPAPAPSVTAFTAAGPVVIAGPGNDRSLDARNEGDDMEWRQEGGVWIARPRAAHNRGARDRDANAPGGRFRDARLDGRDRQAPQVRNDNPGFDYRAPRLAPSPGFPERSHVAAHSEAPRAPAPRAAPPAASQRGH